MLEVGGIVDARCEHDHGRIGVPLRRHMAQHFEKFLRIAVHRTHRVAAEKLRKNPLHGLAIFEQVGNTRGAATVVLKNHVGPVGSSNEIRAANVDINVMGHIEPDQLGPVVLGRANDFQGDHPLLHDPLIMVDIMQKKVQRAQTLLKAPLKQAPLVGGDDTGNQIERHDALGALVAAVNGEGDSLVEIGLFRKSPLGFESDGVHFRKALENFCIVGAHGSIHLEHLIKKSPCFVLTEKALHPVGKHY